MAYAIRNEIVDGEVEKFVVEEGSGLWSATTTLTDDEENEIYEAGHGEGGSVERFAEVNRKVAARVLVERSEALRWFLANHPGAEWTPRYFDGVTVAIEVHV